MRTGRPGYTVRVSGVTRERSYDVECPHCHKPFAAGVLEGSAARYRGFKCPHCRLFVPYERANDQDLVEPLSRDGDES